MVPIIRLVSVSDGGSRSHGGYSHRISASPNLLKFFPLQCEIPDFCHTRRKAMTRNRCFGGCAKCASNDLPPSQAGARFPTTRCRQRLSVILKALLIAAAFVNATPSLEELCPRLVAQEQAEDEIVGSGYEASGGPARTQPSKRAVRRTDDRKSLAARRIEAAKFEIARQDPELSQLLASKVPSLYRDDSVGTIIWSDLDSAIRYNRTYVMSLSPVELADHVWQLAIALVGPR